MRRGQITSEHVGVLCHALLGTLIRDRDRQTATSSACVLSGSRHGSQRPFQTQYERVFVTTTGDAPKGCRRAS